ncbi:ABC transporter permease [Streptomyces gamaensis]|uniref:ABC transporter permease n=1 Tax=Streptomyces gamaensis TaxID=1763542 RepID=A0ABW0YZY2_9ACTN
MTAPAPQPQHTPQPPAGPLARPAQPHWPGAAPFGGYTSPIPLRKAHLGDAVAAEWTKIRSLRSTMWTLGVQAVLIIGIGILFAAAVGASDAAVTEGTTPLAYSVFGTLLGLVCVITLGVLTMSSEFGTGLVRTTFTACPDRTRVLAAKAIVYFLLVTVVTTVAVAVTGAVSVALLDGRGFAEPTGGEWLRSTLGTGVFTGLVGLVALAVGTLLRHSAGAITAMLGLVLLPMVAGAFMYAESLMDLRQALIEYSIPYQLFSLYGSDSGSGGPGGGGPLTGWDAVWLMLAVAAAALTAACATLTRRDA